MLMFYVLLFFIVVCVMFLCVWGSGEYFSKKITFNSGYQVDLTRREKNTRRCPEVKVNDTRNVEGL